MRFLILGNPENRRVGLFQAALAAADQPVAAVVSWLDFLRGPRTLPAAVGAREAVFLRVDSAGESFDVERELLALGYPAARKGGFQTIAPAAIRRAPYDLGKIIAPRQQHLGFLRALDTLAGICAEHPRWRVLNPPATIADLFDKRVTSRRYQAIGLPVPLALDGATDRESLRALMRAHELGSVYVKLSCSSSASCLAIYDRRSDSVLTTIEQAQAGWYNSLQVRRVRGARAAEILAFLLSEGSQVEADIPKATLGGLPFDCRVLVVAGEPAFTVIRRSEHPITNLHLGGTRGDPAALAAAAPPGIVEAALESCRAVGRAHDTLHVGVDVMYEAGFTGHRILEANAFGDLLPNLSRDGLDVYGWEIRAALRRI